MTLPLELPLLLLLIPFGLIAVSKLVRQKSSLGFSSATLLKGVGIGFPLLLVERLLLSVFVITVSLILARPTRTVRNSVPVYQQARDISIVLDISGSMAKDPITTSTKVIAKFVEQRPQDRIALFVFNDRAYLEWPLSVDHEPLIFRLSRTKTGGGTQIASGIIAGLNHQHRYGQNAGAIIVVSDGSSDVTAAERNAIETTLGQTKFYWIWIGQTEDKMTQEFALYVQDIGGQIFHGKVSELDAIFSQINQLEASPVVWEQHATTIYHFGLLPFLAMTSLFLAAILDLIREV